MTEENKKAKKEKGGYFTIDRRIWLELCGECSSNRIINPAVAYLVQASGTQRDNKSTNWSIHSIEKFTGISRANAYRAIEFLKEKGYVKQTKGGRGTGERSPRYEILSYDERKRWKQPKRKDLKETPPEEQYKHTIWLPNTITTGAKRETPPVEKLRRTHKLDALKLFVDCYFHHDLKEKGGMDVLNSFYRSFELKKIGEYHEYVLWSFQQDTLSSWDAFNDNYRDQYASEENQLSGFWDALGAFERQGLINFVPYVYEGDRKRQSEAEVLHPYPVDKRDPIFELSTAAHNAGIMIALILKDCHRFNFTERERWWEPNIAKAKAYLLPLTKDYEQPHVIGIPRLVYRPKTTRTSQWFGKYKKYESDWRPRYVKLAEQASREYKERVGISGMNPQEKQVYGQLF